MKFFRIALVLTGSILLISGLFSPLIKIPFLGDFAYYDQKKAESYFIISLALLAVALVVIKQFKFLWIPATALIFMLGFNIYEFYYNNTQYQTEFENMFPFMRVNDFTQMFIDAVEFQWGMYVMFLGAAMIVLAASLMKRKG
jgi:hypothetical protein